MALRKPRATKTKMKAAAKKATKIGKTRKK
jgi:hypothetical protein